MKILLTTLSLDLKYGAGTAERTRQLALHMSAQGCSCTIVAMNGQSWSREFAEAGIDVWTTGSIGRRFPVPTVNPRRLSALIRSADAIHVMGYWNLLSALVCIAARIMRKPYVLCAAGEFAKIDTLEPVSRLFHWLFGRAMIGGASSLIAITALERAETLARLGNRTPPVLVFGNGIGAPPDSPHNFKPAMLPNRPYILFMGRLAHIKGPDLLLRAFALLAPHFPDVDLVFAGPDGGMGSELRRMAASLDMTARVHWLGFVDERQRSTTYRKALVLAVTSRSEAMSLVALEAAACGTMVLLTDRCGFDAIADGGGMVVPAEVNPIADGLRTLLERPEELAPRGAQLRGFVLSRYAWPVIVNRLLGHLSSLAGKPLDGPSNPTTHAQPPSSDRS